MADDDGPLSAAEVIATLGLAPLEPEGGWFAETWRSGRRLENRVLGLADREGATHSVGGAIYFLLTADTRSAPHRLATDEQWYFHAGDPVTLVQLHPDGSGERAMLGADLAAGELPQVTAAAGSWFGAWSEPVEGGAGWSLLGTSMAPGFEWGDIAFIDRESLLAGHPAWANEIAMLYPGDGAAST